MAPGPTCLGGELMSFFIMGSHLYHKHKQGISRCVWVPGWQGYHCDDQTLTSQSTPICSWASFWMHLWGSFWMRFLFGIVSWLKQVTFPIVTGDCWICQTERRRSRMVLLITELSWSVSLLPPSKTVRLEYTSWILLCLQLVSCTFCDLSVSLTIESVPWRKIAREGEREGHILETMHEVRLFLRLPSVWGEESEVLFLKGDAESCLSCLCFFMFAVSLQMHRHSLLMHSQRRQMESQAKL